MVQEVVFINSYPEKLSKTFKSTHPKFKDVVFEYDIKDGYKGMKFLGWRFSNYQEISDEINKVNYADLEDYGLSLEAFFYNILDFILNQIEEIGNNKEILNELDEEGILFYNYWSNKIKGV
jgi:hypothetical protein